MALSTARTVRLFIGTYTNPLPHVPNAKGEGIYVCNLTMNIDGSISLTRSITIPKIANPQFLAVTQSKKYLYTLAETSPSREGRISAFQISAIDQNPLHYPLIGAWPTEGTGPCHVTVDSDDHFVFVTHYCSGSVTAFEIDSSTGRLEKCNFHQFSEFSNVNKERQDAPHLHSSILDRNSRFIFFADLGDDCIWRMDYSRKNGFDVESLTKFQTPPGSGPRHMAIRPIDNRYLYVSCELSNRLLVFKIDEKGDLNEIQYVATLAKAYQGAGGAADVHATPDGRFIYVSTRFIDAISAFEIGDDGKVSLFQEIESGGEIPRNILFYQPFQLLLVANQQSHDVTAFQRDPQSGKLSRLTKWQVNTPVCLKILD